MGAGAYHQLYTIERQGAAVKDAAGQSIKAWVPIGTTHGRQVRNSERKVMDAGGVALLREWEVETPWHPGLDARCRLVEHPSGAVCYIGGAVDPDNGRRFRLMLTVRETVPA